MLVPGLEESLSDKPSSEEVKVIDIPAQQEYRYEIDYDSTVKFTLQEGSASIFGVELILGHEYELSGTEGAVFTWKGCKLQVVGNLSVGYIGQDTPMVSHLNLSYAIQQIRDAAKANNKVASPRICVIGPVNVGKTTLVKTLAAYASRQSSYPLIVNTDPREGLVTPAGSICCFTTPAVMQIEPAFGATEISGPQHVAPIKPLTYFLGYTSISDSYQKYTLLIKRLALACLTKLGDSLAAGSDGLIVDSPGHVESQVAQELYENLIKAFEINILIVIGSERLYSDMKKRYESQANLKIIRLPRISGSADRPDSYFRQSIQKSYSQYFFGGIQSSSHKLNTYSCTVNLNDLTCYRTVDSAALPASLLPIGYEESEDSKPKLEKLDHMSMSILQNSILAVSHMESNAPMESILKGPVKGFIFVSNINDVKHTMSILSPTRGFDTNNALLVGNIKWQDQ